MSFDTIRPLLSRTVAALLLPLLAVIFRWAGVDMPADLPGMLGELAGALIIYTLIHRTIDRKINPGDAASPKIAKIEKRESQNLFG